MRRFGRVALALISLMLAGATSALAERRIALLIGNQEYAPEVGRLSNPNNDVALLEGVLKHLGFDVTTVRDAGLAGLHQAVNTHVRRVRQSGPEAVGFFYYSGHGAADGTTNYLIPVDVKTIDDDQLWDQSLRLTEITRKLKDEAGNATHFVVFDACRNTLKLRKTGTKAIVQSKGFVPVSQESGMLIAYATAEGALASDVGTGAGPYATALADEVVKPGLEAVAMFRNVQRRVRTAIGQEPYLGFNALGDIYFAGQAPPAAVPGVTAAAREWSQVDKTSIAELETFVHRHGSSPEADYARARIDGLKQAAATGSPKPAAQPIVPPRPDAGSLGQSLACVNAKDQDGCERAGCTWFLRSCMTPANALAAKLAMEKQSSGTPARCEGVEAQVGKEKRCLKPKDIFRDCPECPEMVVVPAGEFMMGSEETADEKPVHKVTIAKPFAVGRFEATFAEWDTCVSDGGCNYRPDDRGWGRDNRPVINVSWDEITKEYVPWLARKTGKTYRFPTEAEWEYAARAGSTAKYTWGNELGSNRANCDRCGSRWDRRQTAPVGSFEPNAFGLFDMHGNVWEWVADCRKDSYANASSNDNVAPGVTTCPRVLRGGSWVTDPGSMRAASRLGLTQGGRGFNYGFRLVRTLSP
jgi:formylglycine-generating enzyme required for sulfatase activity